LEHLCSMRGKSGFRDTGLGLPVPPTGPAVESLPAYRKYGKAYVKTLTIMLDACLFGCKRSSAAGLQPLRRWGDRAASIDNVSWATRKPEHWKAYLSRAQSSGSALRSMTTAAVRRGSLCRAFRTACESCARFRYASVVPSAVDSTLVYFHTEEIDIFWHNLDQYNPGEQNGSHSSAHNRAENRKLHNERIRQDWADYNEGFSGQLDRLQSLQARILPPIAEQEHLPIVLGMSSLRIRSTCRIARSRTCSTTRMWTAYKRCIAHCAGAPTHLMLWQFSG
jgi:hypothetical protein